MKIIKNLPKYGDKRERIKFCFLPMIKTTDTQRITYWLCRVKITQRYAYKDKSLQFGWIDIDITDNF